MTSVTAKLRRLHFAVLMAAMVLIPGLAVAEKLPLDDRGNVIQALKFSTTQFVTVDSTSTSIDSVFESGSVGTSIIRIVCDVGVHVAIETSLDATPTATTADVLMPATAIERVKITSSNDRFAVLRSTTSNGGCWFTLME